MKYLPNGFIKPDGTFIGVAPQDHERYLLRLRRKGSKEDFDDWIKVSESCMGVHIFLVEHWNKYLQRPLKPTQAQIDTLFSWAKKFNNIEEYNDFLRRNDL